MITLREKVCGLKKKGYAQYLLGFSRNLLWAAKNNKILIANKYYGQLINLKKEITEKMTIASK